MEKTIYVDGEVLTFEEVKERLDQKQRRNNDLYWSIGCNIVMLLNDIESAKNYRKSVAELENALNVLGVLKEEEDNAKVD